jgi:dCTP deaminase
MILSAQTIRRLGIVEPFHERTVHAGKTFGLSVAGYDVRIDQDISLQPGAFKLASIMERLTMPNDVLAQVCDKSSWARKGLACQNTIIEPGWCGYLTIELTNHSQWSIFIRRGEPIAQIIFHRLDEATEHPYSGKYQNQEAGPQPARDEK